MRASVRRPATTRELRAHLAGKAVAKVDVATGERWWLGIPGRHVFLPRCVGGGCVCVRVCVCG